MTDVEFFSVLPCGGALFFHLCAGWLGRDNHGMQEDPSQIHIPPSFLALYCDARQRLNIDRATLHARYELCEDLACHLIEQARQLCQSQGAHEAAVLASLHAGLRAPGSGLSGAEARWVVLRLAELLSWPSPALE
ncbi:hypothetical protein MASR1M59_09560 [Melaminivora sp.]